MTLDVGPALTLAQVGTALTTAGLVVEDHGVTGLALVFEDEETGVAFDLRLSILNGNLIAEIEVADLPLDRATRDGVRRWLERADVSFEMQVEADGDTTIGLVTGLAEPVLADVVAWVEETAAEVGGLMAAMIEELDAPDEELAFLRPAVELNLQGRPLDAVAELERLSVDGSPRSDRARGFLLSMLGELLLELGRAAAVPTIAEGVTLLAAAGEELKAALLEVDLVNDDVDRGALREALARCDRLEGAIGRFGDADDLDFLAMVRGQVLLLQGNHESAIGLLAGLEQRVSQVEADGGSRSPHLAGIRMALGLALMSIGSYDAGHELLEAAQRRFAEENKAIDVSRCEVNRAACLAKGGQAAEALDLVARARPAAEALGQEEYLALLDFSEAQARRALQDPDWAGEAFDRSVSTLLHPGATGALWQAAAHGNAGLMAQEAGDIPGAIAAFERAAAIYEELDLPVELAKIRHNLVVARMWGAALRAQIDPADAARTYDDAMAAVRLVEEARPRLTSASDRARWVAEMSSIFGAAVMVCHAAGAHRVAVDLIERARAQGMPRVEATDPVDPADPGDDECETPAALRSPVTGEERVLTAVRAALHDLDATPPDPGDVVEATRAVGGPHAWRWTMWQAAGCVLWGVLEPDGTAHSGFIGYGPPPRDPATVPGHILEQFHTLVQVKADLERMLRAQGVGVDEEVRRRRVIREGALVEDHEDEEPALAWDLGRKLVPPPVQAELRRRLARGAGPLPLVIAPSPGLARVPFGLLGIEEPSAEVPFGRRLLEAAVVTIAAPSSLATERVRRRLRTAPPLPIVLAVLDPTGDRRNSAALLDGHPDLEARVEVLLGNGAARPADQETVVGLLRHIDEGRPGVLVWAGHAEPGPGRRPLDAHLPLTRGPDGTTAQRLDVEDLLLRGLHVPSRAVLHGCTTVGVDDDLTEWWGFPVALMYAGASAVAATTWDVLDTPATARMAAEVLRCAVEADDLAIGLRDVQLRWLAGWVEQRAAGRKLSQDVHDRHPHLWAGWTVVGTHYG